MTLHAAALRIKQMVSPSTPASGENAIYPKADNRWYSKDSGGIEIPIGVATARKESVRCATTANLTSLSTLLTIDGIATAAGDRVLVKNQTAAAGNGIYIAATGAWTRAPDCNTAALAAGAMVFAASGANGGATWFTRFKSTDTLGTTAMDWWGVVDTLYGSIVFAPVSHTHAVTDLTATGTKDTTTFLRGDNTWAVPASSGGPPSGAAGGDLAGSYPNPTIGTSKVTSTHILDATIAVGDLAVLARPAPVVQVVSVSTSALAATTFTGIGAMTGGDAANNVYLSGTSVGTSTFKVAGMYMFNCWCTIGGATAGRRILALNKNGAEVARADNSNAGQAWTGNLTWMMPMGVGDTLNLSAYSSVATNLGANPGHGWQAWRINPDTAYSTASVWP